VSAAVRGDASQAGGGDGQAPITAADVAAQTGGRLIGEPGAVVRGIAPLDRAGPTDLSFLAHARYVSRLAASRAGVVLVTPAFEAARGTPAARIVVEKPIEAMLPLLARFARREMRPAGLHATAVVAASAQLGAGVTVDAYAVIGEHVVVGDGCWIGVGASVGEGSVLGRDVRLHPHAVVYPFAELGDRVVLHAGAQVGREGFGFVPRPDGVVRIPHIGRCVLEHDVEIGANSCVDRGSIDDTVIGAGTKIDSLVQVGHNVRMGRFCFVASQAGVAGSSRIEDGVQVGGQAGVGGHLTIGAKATVAAQAGVIGDIPGGEVWSGYPARPHRDQLRAYAAIARLAQLIRPLERLLTRDPPQDQSTGAGS
jgi:UDP-3-O-[3-hydroxymyristoyl] glucosamine N-acyltransferase